MDSLSSLPRVIVAADDDSDDVDLMKILLRKAGIQHPVQFFSGGDALITALSALLKRSVKAALPLLCFLDIRMPGMSGFDVLEWIRGQPKLDAMSVVMLSSSDDPADVRKAASSGAQCYLAKYPQPAVL